MADDPNKYDRPSTPRAEYLAVAPDIQLIRDELGGTRAMHRNYRTYIPKFKSEANDRYKIRAQAATFYGGIGRSLSASVGMLFAKPPQKIDRWTPELEKHAENIDGKGTLLDVFAKRKTKDALADGFVALLVDHPVPPADVLVHAGNEDALNLRPIWSSYSRADVLSWVTEVVNAVETVVQVVLREGGSERVGAFGVQPVLRFRVCRLAMRRDPAGPADGELQMIAWWEVVEERDAGNGQVKVVRVGQPGVFRQKDGTPFDEIPLAVCYTGDTDAAFVADPPLLDLAWANLEYWQIACELRWYEKMSAYPQPTIEGELAGTGEITADNQVIKPTLSLGPTTVVQVTAGSKFYYTETSGKSFDGLRASLSAKKDEMAELGASFLAKKTRGVETAEAKRLDATAENSTLATAAQGVEDGFNEALRFHARYLGIPAEQAPTIQINRDFEGVLMDAPVMQAYVQLVNAGYPKRLVLEALQVGGRIAEDADLDALEQDWEAGLQAAADQAAMDAQAQAQQTGTRAAPPASQPPAARSVKVKRDKQGRVSRLVTVGT
ncbi:MAG: DUF4055 domain-containing protein [Actinobacteria bacterium]|nr:DUF4055 domain-containing protein [Actinomycetota bacterium]